MKNIKKAALTVVVLLGGISYQAHAGGVNTYAGLGANDSISWGQLGGSFDTTTTPVGVVSGGGLNALVTDGGDVERRDEDPGGGGGWLGIFNSGDQLLFNQDNGNDIVVTFAMPVYGAGAYIQQDQFGDYSGTITAYSGATVLGSETVSADNNGASLGTAPFAGWLESSADITSVDFSTSPEDDFCIDTLALVTNPAAAPDAASTSWLLGMASLGLGIFRKKLVK
jgi:hypothetical protein